MRFVLLGVMAVLGWVYVLSLPRDAAEARSVSVAAAPPQPFFEWRRTAKGWERADHWPAYPRECAAPFHPLALATGQFLVSVAALALAGWPRPRVSHSLPPEA